MNKTKLYSLCALGSLALLGALLLAPLGPRVAAQELDGDPNAHIEATPAPTPQGSVVWSPVEQTIGFDRQGEPGHEVWVPDGRMIQPVDQRGAEPYAAKTVVAGVDVPCSVETAHDYDTKTTTNANGKVTKEYAGDKPLTYIWQATVGHFVIIAADGTRVEVPQGRGERTVWVAPDNLSETTMVTIWCTIDDPIGDRVSPPETGSRDDKKTLRIAAVRVLVPAVEFGGDLANGSVRACAGGFDDHAAVDPNPDPAKRNDSQYRAHTRLLQVKASSEGAPVPDVRLALRFDGNKGHDYGDNAPLKTAKLHRADELFDEAHPWQESLEVQADERGHLPDVWVLSSDVINQSTLQAVLVDNLMREPTNEAPKEPVVLGKIGCDFAAPVRLRRFTPYKDDGEPLMPDEASDTGWIFDFPHLVDPESEEKLTPAKLYFKFKKFEDKGADYTYIDSNGVTQGNWQFVNSHETKLFIAQIDLSQSEGGVAEITGTPEELRRYAFVNLERAASQDNVAQRKTAGQGETLPQVYVKAGTDIQQVKTVWVDAQDLSVWKD